MLFDSLAGCSARRRHTGSHLALPARSPYNRLRCRILRALAMTGSPPQPAGELPRPAALLLGPTGAGKTPLGDLIERRGLWGAAWRHFDFGAQLRRVAAGSDGCGEPPWANEVRRVLAAGALLRDDQFPIAAEVLQGFLALRDPAGTCRLVLNGLPRHVGQAEAVQPWVDVRWVIHLECDAATVAARIARDVGGDRGGRTDDDPAAIAEKLSLFRRQTSPLLAHYAARGVPCLKLPVGPATKADEIYAVLAAQRVSRRSSRTP